MESFGNQESTKESIEEKEELIRLAKERIAKREQQNEDERRYIKAMENAIEDQKNKS